MVRLNRASGPSSPSSMFCGPSAFNGIGVAAGDDGILQVSKVIHGDF